MDSLRSLLHEQQGLFGLVVFCSYAEAGIAHADLLSSLRKRKTLCGIRTSPSVFLMSTSCLSVCCLLLYLDRGPA